MDNVKTDCKDIFSEDVSQLTAFKIYGRERVEAPAAVIEADASLNSEAKAKAFSSVLINTSGSMPFSFSKSSNARKKSLLIMFLGLPKI